MDDLAALADQIPAEVLEYVETLEADVEKAEAENVELQKALEGVEPAKDSVEDDDPIAKALSEVSDEAAAIFKAQAERLEQAEAKIKAQEEARADSHWIGKAASFDGVIDDPADFGPQLRKVADVDPELADKIASVLETAASRLEKSALFSELGSGPSVSPTDVQDKVVALAKSLQEADPTLTEEAARAEVWTRNPDLYEQYQAELRERARNA